MKIVSFYSYKGGVGRSLLIANLAAYLCHYKGRRVLLVDWDLEAPGLHYYFNKAGLKNKGVMELLGAFVDKMREHTTRDVDKDHLPTFDDSYIKNLVSQGKGQIDLITAGIYDQDYTLKINDFNWEEFYKSYDGLTYVEFLKQKFKEMTRYDYVFIDSRTGVSDYWGIINIQMPDINVFVVAPTNQNFAGVTDIAQKIQFSQYVKDGNREAIFLPLLSRLDPLNNQKQGEWFALFRSQFRSLLESLLQTFYHNGPIQEKQIDKFIDSTLLNYKTDLSYGEQVLFDGENKKIEYNTIEKKYEDIASIIECISGKNGSLPGFLDEEGQAPTGDIQGNKNIIVQGIGESTINIQTFLGTSVEYKQLLEQKQNLESMLSLTPVEDLSKRVELSKKIEEQKRLLDNFEQDVRRLAETFSTVEVNTERLIKVKALIEAGKINEARETLETDASELLEEQERLLEERDRLINRSQDIEDQLKSNAEQFLILAQTLVLEPAISERHHESVRKYFESSIKSFPLAENLLGYALFLHHHNQLDEAEKRFEKYLSEFGKKGEPRAKGLIPLAVLHINTNNFKAAQAELGEALKIYQLLAKKDPDKYMTEVAQTLSSLGLLYGQINKFQGAETSLTEALQIYRVLGEKAPQVYLSNIAAILNNLGTLHYNLNDFNRASVEYEEALKIRRELAAENPSAYLSNVAATLTNIGALCYERREYDNAEMAYQEALTIQRELTNQNPYVHLSQMFGVLNNLGNLYGDINEFDKSLESLNEALGTYQQLSGAASIDSASKEYSPYVALTLNNLGTVYLNNNKLSEAENYFTQAHQIYKNLMKENPTVYDHDLARVASNLGTLYSDRAEIEKAENYYQESLKVYRRLAKTSPQPYLLELSKILINFSIFYLKDSPNREKSLSMALEAEKILNPLKTEIPYSNTLLKITRQVLNAWDLTHDKD